MAETQNMTETQETPEWQERENFDDYLITSEDLVTEMYVIQNRPAMTLVGLASLANEEGIDVKSVETRETEKEIIVIVSGEYKGITRWASHAEPKKERDEHVWAKAFSKAQRNLFKIFLYGHQKVKDAFKEFAEQNGKGSRKAAYQPPNTSQHKSRPKTQSRTQSKNGFDKTAAREKCERIFEKKSETIAEQIDVEIYWREVENYFDVDTLDDLSKEEWLTLTNDLLKKGFGEITRQIIQDFS